MSQTESRMLNPELGAERLETEQEGLSRRQAEQESAELQKCGPVAGGAPEVKMILTRTSSWKKPALH